MRHRTQLYLDGDQYRWLRKQAGGGSMADVVRRLIDEARTTAAEDDPLVRLLLGAPAKGERRTTVTDLDADIYG